jgi:membrane peptidoglycan carboxypeptidase
LNCDLQPIVDMALKLGMNGLKQPIESGSKVTLGQEIVSNQYVLPIALGSGIGTSPLELAGAYAAIANGGNFNAPAPILSITDETGKSVAVKRTPAVRVVSPQVAAQAIDILTGDTKSPGTSATEFQSWYSQNSSLVAGKTGTAVDGGSGLKNSALWFVGMTPSLVATTAIINPSGPSNAIATLPGVSSPATNAFGDYASGVWLSVFAPTLAPQHWSWPDPNSPSFGTAVPPVIGMTYAAATAALTGAGFKIARLGTAAEDLHCASSETLDTIAYSGPQLAPKGSTITVCPSSGTKQFIYRAPVKKTTSPVSPGGRTTARTGTGTRPGGRTITVPGTTITVPPPPTS